MSRPLELSLCNSPDALLGQFHQHQVTSLHSNGPRHPHLHAAFSRQQHENEKNQQQTNSQHKEREKGEDARENIFCLLRVQHALLLHLDYMHISGNPVFYFLIHTVGKTNTIDTSAPAVSDEYLCDVVTAPFDVTKRLDLAQNKRRVTREAAVGNNSAHAKTIALGRPTF